MRKHDKRARRAMRAAASIAAGTSTYAAFADPVRFDNPDFLFDWRPPTTANHEIRLDIRKPAAQQSHEDADHDVAFGSFIQDDPGGAVVYHWGGVMGGWFLPPSYDAGTAIGSGGFWDEFGLESTILSKTDLYGDAYCDSGDLYYSIPCATQTYLGVRFMPTIEGEPEDWIFYYGWIGIELRLNGKFDAFAWGYETEPFTSIRAGEIPEPTSALALLALGFVAARRR